MASFASIGELQDYLQGIDLSDQKASAQQALDFATGLIQEHCRQTLLRVVDDAILLHPYSTTIVRLPQRPVISVASVIDNGIAVVPSMYELHRDILFAKGRFWGGPVLVTYTHGFETIPMSLKNVCLQVAARIYENPRGLINNSESTTGSRAWPNLYGLELSRAEMKVLNRYRRTITAL